MRRTFTQSAGGVVVLIMLGLTVALSAVGALHIWRFLGHGQNVSTPKVVFYEVKKGATPRQIARDLESIGVVGNARIFRLFGRLTGQNSKIKVGDYRFTNALSPNEVFRILTSGVSYGLPLIIPEGYSIAQIAGVFEEVRKGSRAQVLAMASDRAFISSVWASAWKLERVGKPPKIPGTLEGYLFPDTYFITREADVKSVLSNMVHKMASIWTPQWVSRTQELKMSLHEVMTLASIVEKETGADFERPLVASVFHNRLKKRMRLQTDPTVIYGIKNYNGNITRKDLETPTPYNTYVIYGLPPGPIANPGRAAVEATLYPKESPFLYFASKNDGTHVFSAT